MADSDPILDEAALLERMTRPTPAVRAAVSDYGGDVVILGVGGKMGPSLAELLVRAGATESGRRVIGVARFSDSTLADDLSAKGVEPVKADLLSDEALASLPEAPFVFLLAGFKFGATGNPSMTWAMFWNRVDPPSGTTFTPSAHAASRIHWRASRRRWL